MCRKLIVLVAVMSGLVLTSAASAADPNLIGWWKFDLGSGTTCMDSGTLDNDGTFGVDYNGLADSNNAPKWVGGRRGERALLFNEYDGGADFITCGNDPNYDINGPMTVMAWVKGTYGDQHNTVAAKGGDSWRLYLNRYYEAKWYYDYADPCSSQSSLTVTKNFGSDAIDDRTWHHIAGVLEPQSEPNEGYVMKLYWDGIVRIRDIKYADHNGPPEEPYSTLLLDVNDLWIGGQDTADEKGERYMMGFMDDVRIYKRALSVDEILFIAKQPFDISHEPLVPGDSNTAAVDINGIVSISWTPSANAVTHNVYFGTSSTPPRVLSQQAGSSYDASANYGGTYYWQIGDVNNSETPNCFDSPIWSFSVADYISIDDFESGFAWTANGDASIASQSDVRYEETKSMKMSYSFANTSARYLEAELTYATAKDFQKDGMKALTLYFLGAADEPGPAGNEPNNLYVRFEDSDGDSVTVPHPDNPNAILETMWQEWNIDLQVEVNDVNSVNTSKIKKFFVVIGDEYRPGFPIGEPACAGYLYVDEIRLHPSRCIFAEGPLGDMAGNNGDCKVDNKDLDLMSDDWLSERPGLVLWYKLDETSGDVVKDSSGRGYDGDIEDPNNWTTAGKIGGCVAFARKDSIDVPLGVLSHINDEITIAFWANGNPNTPETDKDTKECLVHAKYEEETAHKVLGIYFPEPCDAGTPITWYTGNVDDSLDGSLMADTMVYPFENHTGEPHYRDQWNHYAFTKDADTGVMTIYINGDPVMSRTDAHQPTYGAKAYNIEDDASETGFKIGEKVKEFDGDHDYTWGRMDDFRIYDYVLSASDIAILADINDANEPLSKERGNFDNSYGQTRVNFSDYAILGDNWLKEELWP